ncbi:DUF4256 domain-containing protein [Olsenella sp. AGMB03486]|uniref:DUF4256 domain-containing protein n=1 Tax=Olsenella sp. AGMB03486 TaxID=3230364 RepID=UPI0034A09D85
MDELEIMKERFCAHPSRHPSLSWGEVVSALDAQKKASLVYMEETGGEPDAFVFEGRLYMADFSPESPKRRSCCYDGKARAARKRNPPETSAREIAEAHGLELVSEEMYLALEEAEPLDEKTTSWILTPEGMRKQGGALFGSRRYGRTFIYCNGADSYYASRGFRACLRLG